MHHSLHPPLVFHFHRDDEALAADRHQFVLCRAAFRQTPQISTERFLNGAALLFDLAPNARQLRRSAVFQRSIGQNLVAEALQEVGEVHDTRGDSSGHAKGNLHRRRRTQGNLPPFRGAVDHQNYVANFFRFKSSAGNPRLLGEFRNIQQARKLKPPARTAKFANLRRQVLLLFNPCPIRGGHQTSNPRLPQRRRGIPQQQLAELLELKKVSATVL